MKLLRTTIDAVLSLVLLVALPLSPVANAGDLLRGGGYTSATQTNAPGSVAPPGTAQARANAADVLARTAKALQSVQAMQVAARKAALARPNNLGLDPNHPGLQLPNVPNGLAAGGLQVAPGVPQNLSSPAAGENPALWQGANLPTQSTNGSQTTVTIKQTAPDALLNWLTFNIGLNTTVNFDQSAGGANAGQWIAFNKINDPSGVPSQILGSLHAQGQVYLINQNGIIFGGSSQVNLNALVASSLPINDNLVSRGLLNNPDDQFLFSALPIGAGPNGTPAFTPVVTDAGFTVSSVANSRTLSQTVVPGTSPAVSYVPSGTAVSLVANTDYTLSTGPGGKTTVTFTPNGLAKVGSLPVSISYSSASVRYGDVTVQGGATLTSPTDAEHVGGKIALIGPNVTNDGTISTPDGQTILAAGLQAGFTAHASTDPSLRGLDVYVGAEADPNSVLQPYAGTATNGGLIEAQRADVTIAGKSVNQLGVIDSTTSVSLNGRIDLLANYNAASGGGLSNVTAFMPQTAGLVTLGAGSVTQILPEWASQDRVVGTQLALPSQINMQGEVIHLAGNATILAPNANVTLNAGVWRYFVAAGSPIDNFVYSNGQIYLDPGAEINVAGSTDVSAPMSENIVAVQLRGAELADSPLQRNGIFRGQTIEVDIRQTGIYNGAAWIGTPLADASGYANLVERTVGELTIGGGTVKLNAGASVVMQQGSSVNASGGWINYQGGVVDTTQVLSNGHIYDISQATPNMVYDGIYTGVFTTAHPKWGLSEDYTNPLLGGGHYENGYVYGGNGGAIAITAPGMALDGSLLGSTVAGPRQRTIAPMPGSLSLVFQGEDPATLLQNSLTPPLIVFEPNASLPPAAAFALDGSGNPLPLSADRLSEVILSPDLVSTDGFGILSINNSDGGTPGKATNEGKIIVPAGVSLAAPAVTYLDSNGNQQHASITLLGANIDIEGSVTAPGGSLSFTVFDYSPYEYTMLQANQGSPNYHTPHADTTRGYFTLGASAGLSTSGLVADDQTGSAAPETLPLVTNGGTITIKSYSANLEAGSTVDVSGGVAVSPIGKKTYGSGGSIDIEAGQDPNIASLLGGVLTLDADIKGYSGSTGGSLTILAPLIQIGGTKGKNNALLLSPDFFSQGGFTSFNIKGIGEQLNGNQNQYIPGVLISPNTEIDALAQSYLALPNPADNTVVLTPTLLPIGIRAPVSLTFNSIGVNDTFTGNLLVRGDLVMGEGSVIQTDPLGSVSLIGGISGQPGTVTVLGSITVPGGIIKISGGNNFPVTAAGGEQTQALPTVDLGPHSLLSVAGVTLLSPDPRGFRTGTVLPGGSITVSGNIVAEKGAVLNVSGATDTLDLPPAESTVTKTPNGQSAVANSSVPLNGSFLGSLMVLTRVDSNGGSITLTGGQELYTDATLLGAAGGSSAQGGSLTVLSGLFVAPGVAQTPLQVTLNVSQSGPAIPSSYQASGAAVIGSAVPGNSGGYFTADSFNRSGLSSLTLKGVVDVLGPVTITANQQLAVGDGGVIFADSAVRLNAPYVALGSAFQTPMTLQQQQALFQQQQANGELYSPTYGPGVLTVNASLIDVGNLSLQNIGKLNLMANGGDVRGDGTLDVAGDITIRAGQVYPATEVSFTIAAYDHNGTPGSVTIASSGSRPLPLSAGGELNIYGSVINQGGVLRAPMGTINLGWDGSGTAPVDLITGQSVATTSVLTLSKGSVTSVSVFDPITGEGLIIPYGLNLNGISWIDPAGTDITTGGVPAKLVNLSAKTVNDQAGSVIDIRGGGDLFAYRFVSGNGGTVDILASTSSFAVIPGYGSGYAPYAPYNSNPTTTNLGSDPGYVNGKLKVGDRIYLGASSGLPAGIYTLLPARYALLPGAFLVTPQSGIPSGTVLQPDGSSIVSGYRFNGFNNGQTAQPLVSSFEVDPQSVVLARAEYDTFYGNSFLAQGAITNNVAVPRLPADAGQLVLAATVGMTLQGAVSSQAGAGGLGGLVDISSPVDIYIEAPGKSGPNGSLTLSSAELSGFGAASLLIGGVRQTGANGTTVAVTTGNITVDNAGAPLTGEDIILVANKSLTLAPNAIIESSGNSSGAETLLFANTAPPGSPSTSDGVLLRVSGDASAQIIRSGVDTQAAQAAFSAPPTMTIGAGATVSGAGVILDSTYATTLDSTAKLGGNSVSLDSGQISILLGSQTASDLKLTNHKPTAGLVLSGLALQGLESGVNSLSLLSYSSIDVYGSGLVGALNSASQPVLANLALHAAEIRGFNAGGGTVTFAAQNILLDNAANVSLPPPVDSPAGALDGTIEFNQAATKAGTIRLGVNALNVDNYQTVALYAPSGMIAEGAGALATQGDLTITTPLMTGVKGASQTVTSDGALTVQAPAGSPVATVSGGLGASLTLAGDSVTVNSSIVLPSGELTLHATTGDVTVGNLAAANLDVAGTAQTFFDLTKYTNGGTISLVSDNGSVFVGSAGVSAVSTVNVSAPATGGNAGSLTVSAPNGSFTVSEPNGSAGTVRSLLGNAGVGGEGGTFSLDVGSLPSLNAIESALTAIGSTQTTGFTQSQSFRVRTGDVAVDTVATAHTFNLSADAGSITVDAGAKIDASGATGGTIDLEAYGSVTLEKGIAATPNNAAIPGAVLTVAAQNFNDAGKGGAITLAAGSETSGGYNSGAVVDIQGDGTGNPLTNATIDLSVASVLGATPNDTATLAAAAAALGDFTGTLHIRAPQTAGNTDLQVNPINGAILNPSSIVIEGYEIYNLNPAVNAPTGAAITLLPTGGAINSAVESAVSTNGHTFADNPGDISTPGTMMYRLLHNNQFSQSLASVTLIEPGAEIINTSGNLTLGTPTSKSTSDWNLSNTSLYRFGPNNSVPGFLTLRAWGNLVFYNALSDGFGDGSGVAPIDSRITGSDKGALWEASLMAPGSLSWSYQLTAGADFAAADIQQVQPLATLVQNNTGSLLLGKLVTSNNGNPIATGGAANALTVNAVAGRYQVIRTGNGSIDISAGNNVELLNQFATIYTAGVQVADTTMGGTFVPPSPNLSPGDQGTLGAIQQTSAYSTPQYSFGGGNVTIVAQGNIEHLTQNNSGSLVADSERELPDNWLYRRGYVNSATGQFDTSALGDIASTTWWIDFSNFFEGVGALGGGNVTMIAGQNISNVDAVVPTNARMTEGTTANPLAKNQTLNELGGGDLIVRAGNDIDGGVYYIERGHGTLSAGESIHTNSTRSPSRTTISSPFVVYDPESWLPTTLFLGVGSFDVSAKGDVLLGPTANPFLLPEGYSNTFWYKTYFSTYSTSDYVDVTSLTGAVTLRESTTIPGQTSAVPILQTWLQQIDNVLNPSSVSILQPWLRLDETSVAPFSTVAALLPSSLSVTAFSGSINIDGNLTLSPSPAGTIDLIAAGSINGLQPTGLTTNLIQGVPTYAWSSSTINLSDADPNSIPGVTSPYAYQVISQTSANKSRLTGANVLAFINALFNETGSTEGAAGVLQTKQALHAAGLLHLNDPNPVHLYATNGSISGLTLFSGKAARIDASQDITDIALYIQNDNVSDVSLVASGSDIIAYDPNSPLRLQALATGNAISPSSPALAGDIQISGPGTLEVLAGRDLNLGVGPNNSDGTGVGITSIGNERNPYLPFAGADIIAEAGIGGSFGLDSSKPDFKSFISQFIDGPSGARYLSELSEMVTSNAVDSSAAFDLLPSEQQDLLAMDIFYLVLRDAGRDHNDPTSAGFGNYDAGFAAVSALFSGSKWSGDITLTSREIKTTSGGNISLLAPGGQLFVGLNVAGTQAQDQGILTEDGGNINIFTNGSVVVGTSRIFTLRGGNEIIWSSTGDIAAGASSKTVQSAPPTRVLIDPQSGEVQTDLAGLATGGGIGVLASVAGVPPGNVDLIAPAGTVDAGDAGIRVTGNINIAAAQVLNASNIVAGGASVGVPTTVVVAPNLAGLTAASNTVGASTSMAEQAASQQARNQAAQQDDIPSIITVEVVGYGGGDSGDGG